MSSREAPAGSSREGDLPLVDSSRLGDYVWVGSDPPRLIRRSDVSSSGEGLLCAAMHYGGCISVTMALMYIGLRDTD